MDINHILRLNLELEADIRLYRLRENNETREMLLDKFSQLSSAINEYFNAIPVDTPAYGQSFDDPPEREDESAVEADLTTVLDAHGGDEIAIVADEEYIKNVPEVSAYVPSTPTSAQVDDEEPSEDASTICAPPIFVGVKDADTGVRQTRNDSREVAPTEASAPNLMKLFTINDKFRFIREIFDNDKRLFEATIQTIATFDTLDQVYDYLLNDLGWDVENESVADFITIFSNHFNAL